MVSIFNLWQLILRGGPMMWPLIILSILTLALGIERMRFLISIDKQIKENRKVLRESLQDKSIKQVIEIIESLTSPYSRILKAGLLRFGQPLDLIKSSMEEVFLYESKLISERMSILSFIINASVLIGLLGTVIGLTVVFHAIQVRSNVLNPLSVGDVAVGIWQSLFSSVFGLMVCILSFSIYSFCMARIKNLLADLQIGMAQDIYLIMQLAHVSNLEE